MPEEQPLQCLIALEIVLETEEVVLVVFLLKVEQLGGCLHYGERRGDAVVHENGDTSIRIEAKEPVLLLLVGADVLCHIVSSVLRMGGADVVVQSRWYPTRHRRMPASTPPRRSGLFVHWELTA